jgi:hypothetical protein
MDCHAEEIGGEPRGHGVSAGHIMAAETPSDLAVRQKDRTRGTLARDLLRLALHVLDAANAEERLLGQMVELTFADGIEGLQCLL